LTVNTGDIHEPEEKDDKIWKVTERGLQKYKELTEERTLYYNNCNTTDMYRYRGAGLMVLFDWFRFVADALLVGWWLVIEGVRTGEGYTTRMGLTNEVIVVTVH
jgi:hypothetical protein